MALDILSILRDFLCYGNTSCITDFQSYASNPMEGIFYLVFFPIVFIIVFIFLLAYRLFPDHKGLNVLISVAFFAFILLQGWYYWFMILGKLWYIVLILLGFVWVALRGLRGGIGRQGGGGGGAHGRTGDTSGIFKQAIAAARDKALGVTATELELLESNIATLEATPRGGHGVDDMLRQINTLFMEMRTNLPKYGLNRSKFNELRKRYVAAAARHGKKDTAKVVEKT